jgi:hypothetical protein
MTEPRLWLVCGVLRALRYYTLSRFGVYRAFNLY